MSDRKPKPCPSCEDNGRLRYVGFERDDVYTVLCDLCLMSGPKAISAEVALDLWNALPRREEFHSELVEALAADFPSGMHFVLRRLKDKYDLREGA